MTETTRSGSPPNVSFAETGTKYWVLRFSPLEQGTYSISLKAADASGTTTFPVGSFTATAPVKDGFVKVSQTDKRYFEYTNGKIFWPIGPVYWDEDFTLFKDTGLNFSRTWMGGLGVYSANWARWKSSGEGMGNEGIATKLAFLDFAGRYPGSDGLSYELNYPGATRYWLTGWMDERSFTPIRPNTTYQVKLISKVSGITGPRVSGQPYGLVVKFGSPIWGNPSDQTVDDTLRTAPKPFSHITATNGWQTFQTTFTTPSTVGTDIYVFLDNVTAGQAYVYDLSIQANGAEVVRNPSADMHLYIEQRPAAFFDWQVQQAEANGIYLKYVLHDKNDPIFNSINTDGSWAGWGLGPGYHQAYNTKSSWLKRQWYRYALARWGYSTAVHSWEAVNEADPNDSVGWQYTQDNLAHYLKNIGADPVMAVTSFWCCSFNDAFPFFSNSSGLYPDIDYVDLHEYSGNPNTVSGTAYTYDLAEWVRAVGEKAYTKNAGKPLIWAENGLSNLPDWWNPNTDSRLTSTNPGTWYHNLLWAQLTRGAAFAPGYWFNTEHMQKISGGKAGITKPFYTFVKDLDFNRGGYNDIQASSTNSKIRTYGQKKSDNSKAVIWIQNSDHEWDKTSSAQSGTVTITLSPNTLYTIEKWDTYSSATAPVTSSQTANSGGQIALAIGNLTTDTALKIYSGSAPAATSTPPPTPTAPAGIAGDFNHDGDVDYADFVLLYSAFNQSSSAYNLTGSSTIDIFDINKFLSLY